MKKILIFAITFVIILKTIDLNYAIKIFEDGNEADEKELERYEENELEYGIKYSDGTIEYFNLTDDEDDISDDDLDEEDKSKKTNKKSNTNKNSSNNKNNQSSNSNEKYPYKPIYWGTFTQKSQIQGLKEEDATYQKGIYEYISIKNGNSKFAETLSDHNVPNSSWYNATDTRYYYPIANGETDFIDLTTYQKKMIPYVSFLVMAVDNPTGSANIFDIKYELIQATFANNEWYNHGWGEEYYHNYLDDETEKFTEALNQMNSDLRLLINIPEKDMATYLSTSGMGYLKSVIKGSWHSAILLCTKEKDVTDVYSESYKAKKLAEQTYEQEKLRQEQEWKAKNNPPHIFYYTPFQNYYVNCLMYSDLAPKYPTYGWATRLKEVSRAALEIVGMLSINPNGEQIGELRNAKSLFQSYSGTADIYIRNGYK